MATVDSSSTNAEVIAAIEDNASYREDGSEAKARAFITAVTIYLRRNDITQMGGDGVTAARDLSHLREELKQAQQWLDRRSGSLGETGRFRAFSVAGFRE